jgi:hypothetical protein
MSFTKTLRPFGCAVDPMRESDDRIAALLVARRPAIT